MDSARRKKLHGLQMPFLPLSRPCPSERPALRLAPPPEPRSPLWYLPPEGGNHRLEKSGAGSGHLGLCLVRCPASARANLRPPQTAADWPAWGHDPGGQRFSPLATIDRGNVADAQGRLDLPHRRRLPAASSPGPPRSRRRRSTSTARSTSRRRSAASWRSIPSTGRQRWAYDAKIDKDAGYGDFASRGVSTWKIAGRRSAAIYLATIDARLIAVDAATGKPCADFGENGIVDLRRGLRIAPDADHFADYEETSPPAVIGDTIVVGSGIADNGSGRRSRAARCAASTPSPAS